MIFKEHKEIKEKDIIERYLLARLTGEEEAAFEEHLLYCRKCREELSKRKSIIDAVQQAETDKVMTSGDKKMNSWAKIGEDKLLLKIAAGIILLVSISSIVYYFSRNETNLSEGRKKRIVETQFDSANTLTNKQERIVPEKPEDIGKIDSGSTNILPQQGEILLAQAFSKNQVFETAIESITRSGKVLVEMPKNTDRFKVNYKIEFKWRSEPPGDFVLVLFTNTGKVLFEEAATSPYQLKKTLKPGLYYWQLETDVEAVYTGKFVVESN
jgi:hypothetical protein